MNKYSICKIWQSTRNEVSFIKWGRKDLHCQISCTPQFYFINRGYFEIFSVRSLTQENFADSLSFHRQLPQTEKRKQFLQQIGKL